MVYNIFYINNKQMNVNSKEQTKVIAIIVTNKKSDLAN